MHPRPKGFGRVGYDPLDKRIEQELMAQFEDDDLSDLERMLMQFLHDRLVRLSRAFYATMPPRDAIFVDTTEEVLFDYAAALNSSQQIVTATVPAGQVWLIDHLYFFARGAAPFYRLVDPGDVERNLGLFVDIVGSNNLVLRFDRDFLAGTATQSESRFPFLNDRVGTRQTSFGIWLLEGESISASYQMMWNAAPAPAVPVSAVGFRFTAYQGDLSRVLEIIMGQA